MARALLFAPRSVTAEQYDEPIRRLESAGVGAPTGRRYNVCFGAGTNLRVLVIWYSQEAFDQTLMPILQQVGLDPGQPEIAEVHNIIAG